MDAGTAMVTQFLAQLMQGPGGGLSVLGYLKSTAEGGKRVSKTDKALMALSLTTNSRCKDCAVSLLILTIDMLVT